MLSRACWFGFFTCGLKQERAREYTGIPAQESISFHLVSISHFNFAASRLLATFDLSITTSRFPLTGRILFHAWIFVPAHGKARKEKPILTAEDGKSHKAQRACGDWPARQELEHHPPVPMLTDSSRRTILTREREITRKAVTAISIGDDTVDHKTGV